MDVFDTNIWVYGITGRIHDAKQLIEDVVQGGREVTVSPYIYQEVIDAFRGSYNSHEADRHMNDFAALLLNTSNIHDPNYTQVRNIDVNQVRQKTSINLISTSFGIQSKDVPVVCTAYEHIAHSPTIYTNDRPFSSFNPSRYNLSNITMVYVN